MKQQILTLLPEQVSFNEIFSFAVHSFVVSRNPLRKALGKRKASICDIACKIGEAENGV